MFASDINARYAKALQASRKVPDALKGSRFEAITDEYPYVPGSRHVYVAVGVRCEHAEGVLVLSVDTWRKSCGLQLRAICHECGPLNPGRRGGGRKKGSDLQDIEEGSFKKAGEAMTALRCWAIGPEIDGFFGGKMRGVA